MQSQQLEVLGAHQAQSRDQIKQHFDQLSNNRLGAILKKSKQQYAQWYEICQLSSGV